MFADPLHLNAILNAQPFLVRPLALTAMVAGFCRKRMLNTGVEIEQSHGLLLAALDKPGNSARKKVGLVGGCACGVPVPTCPAGGVSARLCVCARAYLCVSVSGWWQAAVCPLCRCARPPMELPLHVPFLPAGGGP